MSSAGKILLIDDSEAILARAREALVGAGYEVVTTTQTVGNGRHLASCDLVILDFHMPGMDGGQVLQGLRQAAGANRRCWYYLLTSDEAIADDYARLGFDGSLRHKGNQEQLVSQVATVFRMRRLAQMADRRVTR